jgi:hypothetical protein
VCQAAVLTIDAAAQEAPFESREAARERAQARLDSLLPVYERASARSSAVIAARQQEEAARAVVGTDTIQVGPSTVVVASEREERARKYFGRAWAYYGPMLENQAPPGLSSQIFAFQSDFRGRDLGVSGRVQVIDVRPWTTPGRVDAAVRAAMSAALLATMPAEQRAWLSPAQITATPELASVQRELVVGLSATLGLCRAGRLVACWSAMGVTGSSDPVHNLRVWFTEAQRRALAESLRRQGYTPGACAEGDMDSCDSYLVDLRKTFVPLGAAARASLVSVALDLGGEGALRRFAQPLGEDESMRDAISRAAGLGADQVMEEWLERVLAAEADARASEKEARFGTVLWILVFMALSARSTRWRLG